jgi:hypothetical protein
VKLFTYRGTMLYEYALSALKQMLELSSALDESGTNGNWTT